MMQLGVLLFGLAAMWASQAPTDQQRRWACLFGLCAQPFWFYETWAAGQWGMFVFAFACTASWLRGLRHYWGGMLWKS